MNGLLRPADADGADVEIVAKEVTAFSLDWVTLQATLDRFQVASASAPSYGLVRDLVAGTFRLLPHTPIRAMGINHNNHFRVVNEEAWHSLATNSPRKRYGPKFSRSQECVA
jgi:hypothetical protein